MRSRAVRSLRRLRSTGTPCGWCSTWAQWGARIRGLIWRPLSPDSDGPSNWHPLSRSVDGYRQLAVLDDLPIDVSDFDGNTAGLPMNGASDVVGSGQVFRQLDRPSVTSLSQALKGMDRAGVEQSGEQRSTEAHTDNGRQEPQVQSASFSPTDRSNFAHSHRLPGPAARCSAEWTSRTRAKVERRATDAERQFCGGRDLYGTSEPCV